VDLGAHILLTGRGRWALWHFESSGCNRLIPDGTAWRPLRSYQALATLEWQQAESLIFYFNGGEEYVGKTLADRSRLRCFGRLRISAPRKRPAVTVENGPRQPATGFGFGGPLKNAVPTRKGLLKGHDGILDKDVQTVPKGPAAVRSAVLLRDFVRLGLDPVHWWEQRKTFKRAHNGRREHVS